jgi:hypothetical protein
MKVIASGILAALFVIGYTTAPSAFVLNGVRWPNAEAVFWANGDGDFWNHAFIEAMAQWNNRSNFRFRYREAYADPCSVNYPPINSWTFRDTICGIAFGTTTLAVAQTRYSGSSIVESDIIFNANKPWNVFSGEWDGVFDFRRVAVHELGHCLGLGHENQTIAIMNSRYSESVETPRADDIAGLRAIYGDGGAYSEGVRAFVTRFYQQCLGREPEPEGLNFHTNRLISGFASGEIVAANFMYSPEFLNRNTTNEAFIRIMYRAFFDREPDDSGWPYYLNKLNNEASRDEVFYGFIYSPEFQDLCNRYGITPY